MRRSCALLALLVNVVLPPAARAEDPRFRLQLRDCKGIESKEVLRLLTIETAGLPGDQPGQVPLDLTVQCKPDQIRIDIVNPMTRRHVERLVPPVEAGQPGAGRVIALAVSQLLVNSWLELYSSKPEMKPVREPVPEPPPVIVAPPPSLTASAHGVVTLRDLSEPLLLYGVRLRLGFVPVGDWSLFADLSFDAGRVERSAGGVDALMAGLGAGASFTFVRAGGFSMHATALLTGRYVRLEGKPGAGSVIASSADGLVGEASLAICPGFDLGGVWIGLDLSGGVTFPRVTGLVENEAPVTLSGMWLGASLGVEAVF